MRHPFDGVILTPADCSELTDDTPATETTATLQPARRTFLGALATLVLGGASGLLTSPRPATAQQATTLAVGEEGGRPPWYPYPPGQGGFPPPGHRRPPPGRRRRSATTEAVGEEGGRPPRRGQVTTQALGEEGGPPRGGGTVTTQALGEEGGTPRL